MLEETHYYPFGLIQESLSFSTVDFGPYFNKIKYNGKEEQIKEFADASGINWVDYGSRMYDNQIGKWIAIDNKSEKFAKWSPYTYSINNPIRFVDVDGNDIIDWSKPISKMPYFEKILFKSNAFNQRLGYFANMKSGENPGFAHNGRYSNINLQFATHKGGLLGKTSIIVNQGKTQINLADISDFSKVNKKDLVIMVSFNEILPSGEDRLLTGTHEFAHVLRMASLISKLGKNGYSIEQLQKDYLEEIKNFGEYQHSLMFSGKDQDYEEMNDDLYETLSQEPFSTSVAPKQKGDLEVDNPGKTEGESRRNAQGYYTLRQLFYLSRMWERWLYQHPFGQPLKK